VSEGEHESWSADVHTVTVYSGGGTIDHATEANRVAEWLIAEVPARTANAAVLGYLRKFLDLRAELRAGGKEPFPESPELERLLAAVDP